EHHRRLALASIVSIGRGGQNAGRIRLGSVLLTSGRAGRQLILVVMKVVEKTVVPLRGLARPGALEATGDRVLPFAAAKFILPAETLLLEAGPLRLGTDVLRGSGGAMGLAHRVAADNQRESLLIIHCHAFERLPDKFRCTSRIWMTAWSLRVHIDQSHVIGA